MRYCRESKRRVPEDAAVCPYHNSTTCLARFGPSAAGKDRRPSPGAAGETGEEGLRLELRGLEGRIHARRRRGVLLAAGAALAVLLGALVALFSYRASAFSYAQLGPDIRITRDAADPTRVTILYRPLTGGKVGFLRGNAEREIELLDRVVSGRDSGEQKLEWRWAQAREGDIVRIRSRQGWSVRTHELKVPAPPPAPPLGSAALAGRVVDATTGKPLPGAEVRVAGTRLTATTSQEGVYRIGDAPEGPVGIKVSAGKYCTNELERELVAGTETRLDVALSPGMTRGQIRIVLTWGNQPADLDAHLEGPLPNGKRFHVFFGDKGDLQSREYVNLDVDCMKGSGPETITVLGVQPGRYQYYIHDFSNAKDTSSTALARSGARVEVYQGGQMLRRFLADGRSVGTVWNVCEIEVTPDQKAIIHRADRYESKELKLNVPLNTVYLLENSARLTNRQQEILKQGSSMLISKLPTTREVKVGVVYFDHTGVRTHALTVNRREVQDTIAATGTENGASLLEGFRAAAKLLRAARGFRNLVVFVAPGQGNDDQVVMEAEKLKKEGVQIAALGFGDVKLEFLRRLASNPQEAGVIAER